MCINALIECALATYRYVKKPIFPVQNIKTPSKLSIVTYTLHESFTLTFCSIPSSVSSISLVYLSSMNFWAPSPHISAGRENRALFRLKNNNDNNFLSTFFTMKHTVAKFRFWHSSHRKSSIGQHFLLNQFVWMNIFSKWRCKAVDGVD